MPLDSLPGKRLELQVVESTSIVAGTTIRIEGGGLVGSKRGTKDGCTHFGTDVQASH